MRYYGFGNYYLSSLQQGLQAGHGIGDMSVQEMNAEQRAAYVDWAKNHKVMVLLNGGNQAGLEEIHAFLLEMQTKGYNYPVVKFHEDEQSLGGALTHVGVIVPPRIYDLSAEIAKGEYLLRANNQYEKYETDLATKMSLYALAK